MNMTSLINSKLKRQFLALAIAALIATSTLALGPVSMLRAFAHSVGRRFIKGLEEGRRLCPEPG